MRMTRLAKFGLLLIAVALVPWGCWTAWDSTRTWFLMKDVPISLSNGNRYGTGLVKTNMDAMYSISISADYLGRIDVNHKPEAAWGLACEIGFNDPKATPCPSPPVWKLHWTLSSDRSIVQGDSDETIGEGWLSPTDRIYREIGAFRTEAGHRYKFDVEVLFDNHDAEIVNPRLMVAVADYHSESSLFLGGLLRVICAPIAIIGAIVSLGSFLSQRLKLKRAAV